MQIEYQKQYLNCANYWANTLLKNWAVILVKEEAHIDILHEILGNQHSSWWGKKYLIQVAPAFAEQVPYCVEEVEYCVIIDLEEVRINALANGVEFLIYHLKD